MRTRLEGVVPMQGRVVSWLATIAAAEAALAETVEEASGRISDPGVAARAHDVADAHGHHADALRAALRESAPSSEEIDRMVAQARRRIEHAETQNGIVAALSALEAEEDERYHHALAVVEEPAASVLRAQEIEVADAHAVFEDQAPGLAPDVGGPEGTLR